MKKSLFILSITIIILFGFRSGLFAQRELGSKEIFKDELNLTETQEKQINNLRYEHQKKVLDLRNEIEKNRLEIKNMLKNNTIDEARFKSLTKKNSELHSQIKELRVDEWLTIYKLLDESQKEIWSERFDEIGEHGMRESGRMGVRKHERDLPGCFRDMSKHRLNKIF